MENRTIKFNVQGDERKTLACAISRILNTGVHYAGAPTFNYEVGEYVIDKNGTLSAPETATAEDVQSLVEQLHTEGFEAVQEEPEVDRTQEGEQAAESNNAVGESEPDADRTQDAETESTVEAEPTQETESNDVESDPEANRTQAGEPEQVSGNNNAEPEYGYTLVLKKGDDFTPTAECNLRKIIEDKGYMIKKALNADTLDFEVADDEVTFPWWSKCPSPDEIQAYNSFITAIVKTAKAQSRVNSKNQQAENEKYAFRCFLLRLGFIGESFKQTRKILLKRLSGNSAFKTKTE